MVNGRLPHFEQYGDHIARYGKGFSQMLNLAQIEKLPYHQYSARQMTNHPSLDQMSDSQQDYNEFEANLMVNSPQHTVIHDQEMQSNISKDQLN